MTNQELFGYLRRCLASQLDEVTVLLDLDAGVLASRHDAIATRAQSILAIASQQPDKLALLEAFIVKTFRLEANELPPNPSNLPTAPKHKTKDPVDRTRTVLVVASNPRETARLQLDDEARVIHAALAEDPKGPRYEMEFEVAVQATDLSKLLLKYEPTILHFSGHGSSSGHLFLESSSNETMMLDPRALADLFAILRSQTECIVLNACYSAARAEPLSRLVSYVIGMSHEIGDDSAIEFSRGFYRALSFGKDYETAFRLGCNQIDLLSLPDPLVPRLRKGATELIATRIAADSAVELTPVSRQTRSTRAQGETQNDVETSKLYTVWYATARKPANEGDRSKGFLSERDASGRAHYGTCEISIPKWHKIGSLGSSWLDRWLNSADDRLAVHRNTPLSDATFFASVRSFLSSASSKSVLVYIHGYNVTFEAAALRAAQIGFDLQFDGVMAFFSWPSKGTINGYAADAASVEAVESSLTSFLQGLAKDTDATSIHIIAHSMGNRALLRSVQRILAVSAGAAPSVAFGQLILAAPDVDTSVFVDLSKLLPGLANRTTLYISNRDKALAFSSMLHDFPRAGFWPPITIAPGIDTIQVQNIDFTFLGHGYFAGIRGMLADIYNLLQHGVGPNHRFGLKPAVSPNGDPYWIIGA
jgi:esterase/lipase superfamily enzyme